MNLITRPRPTSRRTGRFGLRIAAASVAMASLIGAAAGLKPNTTYHVLLMTPVEGNLDAGQAIGQFTTKKISSIKATFGEIHVSKDGDTGAKGAGDLWWYFDTSFSSLWTNGSHRPVSSGDSFAPAINVYQSNPSSIGESVTVTAQAVEDDEAWLEVGCSTNFDSFYSEEPVVGSTHCVQMSFAQTSVKLPTYVFEEQPQPFTATTTESGRFPIWFTVSGTVQVTYA